MRARWALGLLGVAAALCQAEPLVRVRARLEPPGPVIVGQPVRLTVDVLVTTWFTGAPAYPELEMPDAIVVLPEERPLNINEDFEGERWFGLSRSYLIYPLKPGEYSTPPAEIVVHYGGGEKSPARVAISEQRFSATVPPEAAGLDYFIPTQGLRIEQEIEPEGGELKVGDVVRRTVRVTAEGTFAMLLPPVEFEAAPGLAVYPDPPRIEELGGDRAGFQGGRRTDSAAYVIEEEGEYELPTIRISWWALGEGRLRESAVPAARFRAAPNPAYGAEIEPPAEEAEIEEAPAGPGWRQAAGRWAGPLGVILAAGGLVYLLLRRLVPKLRRRIRERREAYRRSEAAAFRELKRACRGGSAEDCLRSLYRWVDRVFGPSGTATVQELAERAGSPEFLRRTLPLLQQDPEWDRRAWLASAREVRRKLRRRERARVQGMELPPLNPTSPGPASM